MIPFLYNVAEVYYKSYQKEISDFTFVFPNRRAGLFFKKYLTQIAGQPLFSPQILTVSDLFVSLSKSRLADRVEMLFELYDLYIQLSGSSESFDEFIFWGEMLLNDFEDVDKYLVDARQLFRNIYDLKEIDAGFSYLTEDQIIAIRRFWANFIPVGESAQKKDFQEMWEVLFELYTEFRNRLTARGLAYEGMIFREVVEKLKSESEFQFPFKKIIFIGLNAHSKSEEVFLRFLQKKGIADFYWDYSSDLVKDPLNKASRFIDKNRTLFPSQFALSAEEQTFDKPVIEVVGIPSAVGQAKYTHSILQELISQKAISLEGDALNTAVVLPDENLLLPTLYSIPKELEKINVTMGYSLHHSAIAGLMELIFELQRNVRAQNGKDGFYYKYVLAILNHRYLSYFPEAGVQKIRQTIIQYNRIIVSQEELSTHPILRLIFSPLSDWNEAPEYLRKILMQINIALNNKRKAISEESETNSVSFLGIESEFIVEYYKTINKLDQSLKRSGEVNMLVETYFRLLKKLITGVSVPFSGEPLSGLQIMGVLETRTLDFDNLIFLSMNEGVFPLKKATGTFIPYNLRKGFDLPTYEHQDSIYAYHFYRLINRAKRIFLLYDTRTEGLQTGEASRYIHQLKHLYADKLEIRERLAVYEVSAGASVNIAMQKTKEIQLKLAAFLQGGERSLSASSINMYLDCPLQFYFSVVEQLAEEEEVTETVEASTFGSIFHSAIEWLYDLLKGRAITVDILKQIKGNEKLLTETIERSFAENYFKGKERRALTGQNFLTGEVMRKYLKQVLSIDQRLTPFTYIESEKRLYEDYVLPSGRVVSLKGFIDRVDEVNGNTRIIDYKTGKGVLRYTEMDQLFDKTLKDRPKAVMQVFMYAHLYLNENPQKNIEPGIYYLRNLFDPTFDADVVFKPNRSEAYRITDFSAYRSDFKERFDTCLEEIFDPLIPFVQTPTGRACEWCPFTNICKK